MIWSFALHNAHPTPGGGIGPSGPGLGAAAAAALGSVSGAGTAGTAPAVVHGSQPPHRPHALCALGECGGTAGTTLSVWGRVVTVPSMATGARKWGRGGVPGRAEQLAMGPGAAGPRVLLGVTAAVGGRSSRIPVYTFTSCRAARSGFGFVVWVWSGAGPCWAVISGSAGRSVYRSVCTRDAFAGNAPLSLGSGSAQRVLCGGSGAAGAAVGDPGGGPRSPLRAELHARGTGRGEEGDERLGAGGAAGPSPRCRALCGAVLGGCGAARPWVRGGDGASAARKGLCASPRLPLAQRWLPWERRGRGQKAASCGGPERRESPDGIGGAEPGRGKRARHPRCAGGRAEHRDSVLGVNGGTRGCAASGAPGVRGAVGRTGPSAAPGRCRHSATARGRGAPGAAVGWAGPETGGANQWASSEGGVASSRVGVTSRRVGVAVGGAGRWRGAEAGPRRSALTAAPGAARRPPAQRPPWPGTCRGCSRPTAVRRRSSCRPTKTCWSATKVRRSAGGPPGPAPLRAVLGSRLRGRGAPVLRSGRANVPAAPRPGWASNGPGCRVSRRRCAVSARFCRGRRSPGAARCPPRYRFSVPGSVLLNRGAREGDVTPRCPTCPPTLAGGSVRCRRCVTRPFSAPPHRIAFLSAERRRNRGAPALVRGVPGRLEIPGWG